MAKRRRASVPKPPPKDLGTPETLAKLRGAPWGDDAQLVQAAQAIRTAICLLAGGTLVSAQDMLHIRHHGLADADREKAEAALLRRYTWWRWEVARQGWVIGGLIAVIAGGAEPSDPAKLREALMLFANAPRHAT